MWPMVRFSNRVLWTGSVKVGIFLTIWATLNFRWSPLLVWNPSHNYSPQKITYRVEWHKGNRHSGDSGSKFRVDPVSLTTSCHVYAADSRKYQKWCFKVGHNSFLPYIPAIQFIIIPSADTANSSASDTCEVHERREHFICHFWSEGCGDFLPVMPHAASWPSNSLVQCNPSRHDGGWIGCVRACPCHVVCSHVTVHRSIG